jgi:hypothetical protein
MANACLLPFRRLSVREKGVSPRFLRLLRLRPPDREELEREEPEPRALGSDSIEGEALGSAAPAGAAPATIA